MAATRTHRKKHSEREICLVEALDLAWVLLAAFISRPEPLLVLRCFKDNLEDSEIELFGVLSNASSIRVDSRTFLCASAAGPFAAGQYNGFDRAASGTSSFSRGTRREPGANPGPSQHRTAKLPWRVWFLAGLSQGQAKQVTGIVRYLMIIRFISSMSTVRPTPDYSRL